MKSVSLIFIFLIAFINNSFGQNNPIENLSFTQSYQMPNNFFELYWDEPLQPHNELIGYNIYRNNELYRFQTESSLYNFYSVLYGYVSNCEQDFLIYFNPIEQNYGEFEIHVTAVYNPGHIESNYLQTTHCYGFALNTNNFNQEKVLLFPNPTNGLLNIENINLEKIIIYDISGKEVKQVAPNSQIDISTISKGFYIIKLFSDRGIITDKIVIN